MTFKLKLLSHLLTTALLFLGCKDAYINQNNPFSIEQRTKASSDVTTMQRGENPMNRPSYEEYKDSIESKPKAGI